MRKQKKETQFSLRKNVKLSISTYPSFIPEEPFTELRQMQGPHLVQNKQVYSIIKKQFTHHPILLQGEQCSDFCVWSCINIISMELKKDFIIANGHCPLRCYPFFFRSSQHGVTTTQPSSPKLPVLIILII